MLKKNNNGFTLIETIISAIIISIIALVCLGVLTSVFMAKSKSDKAIKQQIVLRQALLTVMREIRKSPDDLRPLIPDDPLYDPHAAPPYTVVDNVLYRSDGSVLAQDIVDFGITAIENISLESANIKYDIELYIKSTGGQEITTTVHLRLDA